MAGKRYRAFISYSRKDQTIGRRLHRWLEAYRVPSGVEADVDRRRRMGQFFRDDDEIGASPDIAATLRDALKASDSLIVVCSPSAARSKWVDAEILYFRRSGGGKKILAVIADGTPNSGDPATECFPPALRAELRANLLDSQAGSSEPVAPDLRTESKARIRIRLAAGLLNLPFDDLWRRERRRRQRLTVAMALALTLFALAAAAVWKKQRNAVKDAARQRAGADAIAKANDASTLLQREPAGVAQAAVLAVETMRSLDRLGMKSVAADTALRDAYRLLPAVERSIPLRSAYDGGTVVSPDGRFIAVRRETGMDLYDTALGSARRVAFEGEPAEVSIGFSADGSTVAAMTVAVERRSIRVWTTEAVPRMTLKLGGAGGPSVAEAIALSPDGSVLAARVGSDVRVWEVSSGNSIASLRDASEKVHLLFSPKARYLAIAGAALRVWEWREGKVLAAELDRSPMNGELTVAFTPDERFIGFKDDDRVGAWEIAALPRGRPWEDKTLFSSAIAFASDNWRLFAANRERVAVYSAGNGDQHGPFPLGGAAFAVNGPGDRVVVAGDDRTARLLDVRGEIARAVHRSAVVDIAFLDHGKKVVTASNDEAMVWRVEGSPDPSWTTTLHRTTAMAVSPDGTRIATFGSWPAKGIDETITIFDARSGEVERYVRATKVRTLAFAGPRHIVALMKDRFLAAWDLAGQPVFSAELRKIQAESVAVSADGETLATSLGGRVTLHEHWRGAQPRKTTLSHPNAVRTMAFDRSGGKVVTGADDGIVSVWDWRRNAKTPLRRFSHGSTVSSITCAGDLVVTTGAQATKVWDGSRDATDAVAELPSTARVWAASIEPNENVLAVVSADRLLRLWSDLGTPDRREIAHIRLGGGNASAALQVGFADDGRLLVSRTNSALEARLWRTTDLVAAACQRLRHNIADDAWSRACK